MKSCASVVAVVAGGFAPSHMTKTGTTANAFKYTAKELSLFLGLPVYDYTARHTLPQINRFRTPDPLAEKYHGISPYAFCAGDPINFSDPTGQLCIFINGYDRGSGGKTTYWKGLDQKLMNKLNDNNVLYLDGSPAKGRQYGVEKNLSADRREQMGREAARGNSDYIFQAKDNGETIKIFTHSMGAKYAKGFADELLDIAIEQNIIDDKATQDLIQFEVDLAPFQPTEQEAVEGVNTVAIHHSGDWVAGTNGIQGAINITNDKGSFDAHGICTFSGKEIYSAICFMLLALGIF